MDYITIRRLRRAADTLARLSEDLRLIEPEDLNEDAAEAVEQILNATTKLLEL